MPKLAVGTPWHSPFMYTDWVDRALQMQAPTGWDMQWFRGKGWCPARRHIDVCEQALDWGADLICIIGADQLHPVDMFPRLIARYQQGYEVVSALVPCRGYVSWQPMKPFQPMAWRFKASTNGDSRPREYRGMELDGDMIEVIDPKAGDMQLVHFIGSGVILFHRDHLLALKKPWFRETIRAEDYQRLANQDCVFVWRLQQEAHAQVWVDTTIKVKHLHIFPIDDTYSERFADWAQGDGDPSICRYRHLPLTAVS